MHRNESTARAVRTVMMVAAGLVGGMAGAADYRFEPRVQVGGIYNDNYRLDAVEDDAVQGGLADVSLQWRAVTPISEFRIIPRVMATYFPGDRDDDNTNGYLNLGYTHQGQRFRFGVDGFYSHESLRTSEQPGAGTPDDASLGGGVGVEAGNTRVNNDRDLVRIAPAASFDLTQTTALELAAEYYMADYEHEGLDSTTDFDSIGGSVGVSFRFSPTQRVLVAATGTRFDPDTPLNGRSTSYGLKGELWTERSEIWQTYLRIGAERTKEDDPEIGEAGDSKTNYILGAGIQATFQVTRVFADYTHGVRPNASGTLVTRDDVRLQVRRQFTPVLSGFVGALFANDEAANDDDDFQDRRYYTGSAGLEYRVTPAFSIVGAYDYRRQKREDEGTGSSNQITLSVVYQPPRR